MNRHERYACFQRFTESAEFMFGRLRDRSKPATEFAKYYSFYAVAGGSSGGIDKRVVEVFYGQRPFDSVETLNLKPSGFPERRTTLLAERGARLMFERTDSGRVSCTLYPSETKDLRAREDFIVLGWLNHHGSINSPELHHPFWRCFISYMACTSLDGAPTFADRLRVTYLRFVKLRSIDSRIQPRQVSKVAARVLSFAFTVGLSGFLLTLINMGFTMQDGERSKAERDQMIREVAETRAKVALQAAELKALKERLAMPSVAK